MDGRILEQRLDNGLVILLDPDPGEPLAALSAAVGAGLLTERGRPAGVSHLVEHLVFKGDGRRTADDLIDAVSARGGSVNAYTFFDTTAYEAAVPAGDLDAPLEVIAALLFDPVFPPAEVELEKKVVLEEIARERDAPDELVFDLQGARFYGPRHPYGGSILGTPESIRAMSPAEIRAYHADHYTPSNVTLAISGGFDPGAALESIVRHFGGRRGGRPPAPPAADLAPLRPAGSLTRHPYPGAESGYGIAGWPAPRATDPDHPAANVAASLLGYGENAFLNRRLALDLGLTASADVIYSPRRGPAQLLCAFAFEPGDEEQILAVCAEEMARLANGDFDDEEFEAAKTKLEADHVFGLEQSYVRADALALHHRIDRVASWLSAVERVRAVGRDDVVRLAREWFSGEPVVVLVDPAEARA